MTLLVALIAAAAFFGHPGRLPDWWTFQRAESPVATRSVTRPPLDAAAVAAGIRQVLVNITASTTPFGAAAGSGIVLSEDGQVLTSHHVVKGAKTVRVTRVADGAAYEAKILGYDSGADIALLSLIGASGLVAARIGSSAQLQISDEVLAMGNAGGSGIPTAVSGRVTDLDSTIVALNGTDLSRKALTGMVEISAAVSSGQSGGALADHTGAVVGVIAAASGDRDPPPDGRPVDPPNGYAVPIDTAMRIVRQIRSGTPTEAVHIGPTATLGVLVSDAAPTGAHIDIAITGLPAHTAGISDGEIITSLDGHPITTARALRAALNIRKPDQTVALGIRAVDGSQRVVRVVLAAGTPH
ncbi:S1C family serine protease [Nocardia paucivorans]|uniref:S1C family serine protease n=1 Tax=Nocardia paucivorans TaxID=114259 RepID=UPI001FE06E6A|nr:trypsin-like peptidase domain-containing protein [Nocardia paucivorans]